jgi:DNA replication protein DnaC
VALVHELLQARDEKVRRGKFAGYKLLIIDELGYAHLFKLC